MLTRIFILIAVVGVLLAGLIFIVPFVLPANTVKKQIENLIAENTGWKIRFGGDVTMSLVPSVRLVAKDIEVSPPNHKPILNAQEARFAVGLRALFSGAVDIEEIYFDRPNLTIELGKSGNPVWLAEDTNSTKTTKDQETVPTNQAAIPDTGGPNENKPGAAGNVVRALVDTLRVERLAIDNANITYGTVGEKPNVLKNINFTASLPDPQGTLSVEGNAVFNGEKITLTSRLPAFKTLINTNKGQMSVEAGYKNATLIANGPFDLDADVVFDGAVDLVVTDISKLASSNSLAPKSAKFTGTLAAGKERIRLDLNEGDLGGTAFASNIVAKIGGARPLITGSIELGDLDLDQLQAAPSSTPTPKITTSKKSKDQPPDLSGLGALDADISFSAASIQSGGHKVDNIAGGLVLNNGVAELSIKELSAVGGAASGRLRADTKVSPLTSYGSLKANSLSIPILLALAGQNTLEKQLKGLISTDLVFGFQGLDTVSILSSANVRGTIKVSKASMDGLDLAKTFNDTSADRLDDISLLATIDDFTKPVNFNGQARWRNEAISLDVTSDLSALIIGQEAKTKARISSSKATAAFNGDVFKSIPSSGAISVKGKSLRDLAKWLGTDLPSSDGYGSFDIKTSFATSQKKVTLNNLVLALDDIKGRGSATILLNDKPDITANITFDLLDVNPYIAQPAKEGAESGSSKGSATKNTSSKWSSKPVDFSFMNAANLDLTARVNTLKAQRMSAGPLTLQTIMRNGKLTADLNEMAFYDGKASAKIVVDTSNQTPALSAKLTSTNIQAYPFLRDATKFERIEGGLDYILDVTTTGNSEAAMVVGLNGKTNFSFKNGAIRGINIAKAMRSLTSGALSGWNTAETEKTDFSSFAASFNIINGVATNTDLNLVGPLVRMTGEGTVQMPAKTLNYRVNPKLVASLEGQGNAEEVAGFGVPIIIEGPWAKPKIYPDIKGFLQDPEAGLAALKSLGGGFDKIASGKTGDIIGALGNDPEGAAIAKAADKIKEKTGLDVGDLLKDGKISKEGGAAAVVGALGGLLGGGRDNTQASTETPQIDAAPLQVGEIPVPRVKPNASASQSAPASAVDNIVKQVIPSQNEGQTAAPSLADKVPPEAEQLLQGLGGLLNSQ